MENYNKNFTRSRNKINLNKRPSLDEESSCIPNLTQSNQHKRLNIDSIKLFDKFLIKENIKESKLPNDKYIFHRKNMSDIMPGYINIKKVLIDKKNKVRKYFDIKNTIFKDMQAKNSVTYKMFIQGFAKLFFGPNGIVTNKCTFLREYYDSRTRKLDLKNKIYAGSLDYYNLINETSSYSKRLNLSRQQFLTNSQNLMVINSDFEKINKKVLDEDRGKSKKNFIYLNIKKLRDFNKKSKKKLQDNDTKKIKIDKKINLKNFIKEVENSKNSIVKINSINKPVKPKINLTKKKISYNGNYNDNCPKIFRKKILNDDIYFSQKLDYLPNIDKSYMDKTKEINNSNNTSKKLKNNFLYSFNNDMKLQLQKKLSSIFYQCNDSQNHLNDYNKTCMESFYDKKAKKLIKRSGFSEDLKDYSNPKYAHVLSLNSVELPKKIRALLTKK